MRETKLQSDCLEYIKKNYRGKLLAVNIHGGGFSLKGFPDLLVFGDGRVVAIELKAGTGYRVQDDQKVWRNRLTKVGIHHYVPYSFDEFKAILEKEFPHVTRSN